MTLTVVIIANKWVMQQKMLWIHETVYLLAVSIKHIYAFPASPTEHMQLK